MPRARTPPQHGFGGQVLLVPERSGLGGAGLGVEGDTGADLGGGLGQEVQDRVGQQGEAADDVVLRFGVFGVYHLGDVRRPAPQRAIVLPRLQVEVLQHELPSVAGGLRLLRSLVVDEVDRPRRDHRFVRGGFGRQPRRGDAGARQITGMAAQDEGGGKRAGSGSDFPSKGRPERTMIGAIGSRLTTTPGSRRSGARSGAARSSGLACFAFALACLR